MPITVTFDIDDAEAEIIAKALDRPTDAQGACNDFAIFSFNQLHEWLDGTARPRSLTDQYLSWIEQLYEHVLPPGKTPTATRIYNSFNLPFGQANYLARALAEKSLKRWRVDALETLKTDVLLAWPTAQAYLAQIDPHALVLLRTSKLGALELIRISDELWGASHEFVSPTPRRSFGDQRCLSCCRF